MDYKKSKIETNFSPFLEIVILGDFNVHGHHRFTSYSQEKPGELEYHFSIKNNLEQMVKLHTLVLTQMNLTFNLLCSFKFSPLQGFADHLISFILFFSSNL